MKNLKMTIFAVAVFAAGLFFGGVGTANAQSGSMEWTGTVDDVVQIRIRNRNVRSYSVSGRDYNDADYYFNGRAPRGNANVRVEKRNGRGRVIVTQEPNRRNDFTTIIQVVDSKGGADRYRFIVYWN